MKLSANNIANIEFIISEGMVAEVGLTEGGVFITKRPIEEHDIRFPHAMLCSEDPCELTLTIKRPGDYPVALGTFSLPPNYWLKAIKGYKAKEAK